MIYYINRVCIVILFTTQFKTFSTTVIICFSLEITNLIAMKFGKIIKNKN